MHNTYLLYLCATFLVLMGYVCLKRYQEYRTEYITTQKRAYFDLNKNDDR